MTILLFSWLALFTAIAHLWADYNGPRWLVYLAKPATTTLILVMALVAPQSVSAFYQTVIVVGLLFSLAGDIFLMLPQDRFMAGLVSFLLAHLWYSVAFGSQIDWPLLSIWGLPVVVFAIGIYRLLLPHLGKLRLPVLAYMVIISLMAWLAITLFMQRQEEWTLWAALGAILFVVSDSTLALNRFRKPFWSAQLIVLGTYYGAQWLIALSV
jgi:uncharacterized membrane protein YhhN